MKIVIAVTGLIISLIHLDQLNLISKVFGDFYMAEAVWIELNNYDNSAFNISALQNLKSNVVQIHCLVEMMKERQRRFIITTVL